MEGRHHPPRHHLHLQRRRQPHQDHRRERQRPHLHLRLARPPYCRNRSRRRNSTYGYDAAGRQLWGVNGNGTKVSNVYDDLGRSLTQWSGEPQTGTKLAEWTYDSVAKGYQTSATRYVGANAYTDAITTYDNSYRPTATKVTIPPKSKAAWPVSTSSPPSTTSPATWSSKLCRARAT
ncbi:hypothetical protein [Nonomuraea salmonea]|uniref:hypothetical protein n=1 Tax=Nonomuraea salmonea TaxID=46181 RepID=UPI002FEA2B07